ncbi:MAG: rRNA maturation RNase YbeY [Bacillota bacterium]|nr:rRNA maturation RNase YbeY [Bacillota bacterium]
MEVLIANDQERVEVGEGLRRLIEAVVGATLAAADAHWRERGLAPEPWVAAVLSSPAAEVSVALVDDLQIHELNRRYRKVNRPTDVLSFPGGEAPALDEAPALLGDVVVSLETAWRQAAEFGHSPEREVGYLVAHGLLHLLGFDHEQEEERATMRRLEEEALARAALPREEASVEKPDPR